MIPQEGAPPLKRHSKIKETSLPEPQMIKRTLLDLWFSASGELRNLRHFRRINKDTSRVVARFEEYVTQLFLLLSNKACVQELPNFQSFKDSIENGLPLKFEEIFSMFFKLGDLMDNPLGITKIEFVKSVAPEDAWEEGNILGED
jgi:hypothetical protein